MRLHHWMSDLTQDVRVDPLPDRPLLVLIATDFYADMQAICASGLPIAMYTFVPPTVAGSSADAVWHLDGNEVVYSVNGGAVYRHRLWRYEGDYLSVVDEDGSLVVLSVQSWETSARGWRVVLLCPTVRIPAPFWHHIATNPLVRREFGSDGPCLQFFAGGQRMLSVAPKGSPVSVELPEDLFLGLQALASTGKLSVGVITQRLGTVVGSGKAMSLSPLLAEVLKVPRTSEVVSSTVSIPLMNRSLTTQVPLDAELLEEADEKWRAVIPALVDKPQFMYASGRATDWAAVDGRILSVVNQCVPPEEYVKFAREFVQSLAQRCVPVSVDQVIEVMGNAAVRRKASNLVDFLFFGSILEFEVFVKGEPYALGAKPRPISNMSVDHNVRLGAYVLPCAQVLKEFSWFGPGQTPTQICSRLAGLRQLYGDLVGSDFSTFDGTISEWLETHVVHAFFYACFGHGDDELRVLLKSELEASGRTTHGVRVPSGPHRKSGSKLTSLANTLVNAFVSYCSLRKDGKAAVAALAGLGLYMGDDGVSPFSPSLSVVARSLGLRLKVEIMSGTVVFLSRVWPDPLLSASSYCDISRAISKVHLARDEGQLAYRANGYLVTDAHTPLVGPVMRAIARAFVPDGLKPKDVLWRESMAWPQDDPELIRQHFVTSTSLDLEDVRNFEQACSHVHTKTDFDGLPVLSLGPSAKSAVRVVGMPFPLAVGSENSDGQDRRDDSTRDMATHAICSDRGGDGGVESCGRCDSTGDGGQSAGPSSDQPGRAGTSGSNEEATESCTSGSTAELTGPGVPRSNAGGSGPSKPGGRGALGSKRRKPSRRGKKKAGQEASGQGVFGPLPRSDS
jgi:hypothetical protein